MSEENNIPKHWQVKQLGKVCDKISLNGIKIKQKDYLQEGKFPVVDQGQEMIGGYFNDEKLVVPSEPPYIIFGDHTKVKKFINFKFIAGADGVKVLKPHPIYDPAFFYYLIHTLKIPDKGYARHFQFLEKEEIPLPPLPEQHRIVSKIEELFSELDKGIESLKTAQQQLKVYRQAVLKWAFEGRLTNENVKDGELPEGWKWVKLGEVLDFVGSGVTPKGGQEVYQISGVIFIRSQNVYPNKLELDDVAFISDEIDERMKRTRVKANDVLLNITGASIGRCAYVPDKFPRGNVNQHVCILRTSQEKLFSIFLSNYLNSPTAQHEIMNTQAGATRQGLNFQQIRNLESPIPPISEQHKIVQEIETRLSVCDKLEETITTALQQSEALRQSILKKAFEGKLIN